MPAHPATELDRRFTWEDYLTWSDDQRREIVDGQAIAMSPSPTSRHQIVVTQLTAAFARQLDGHKCIPLVSPIDVKLSEADVLQPDLVVVCDHKQIKGHIEGPPNLVVEVQSPSTVSHDRVRKLNTYAKFGVQEYWIVSPYPSVVDILVLIDGFYQIREALTAADTVHSPTIPAITFDLRPVFSFPIDPEEVIEEVHESLPPWIASE